MALSESDALVAASYWLLAPQMQFLSKREPNGTFPDAGVTAMLGSMIEMDGWGDGRGVVRGS